jgi:hypothetical protein
MDGQLGQPFLSSSLVKIPPEMKSCYATELFRNISGISRFFKWGGANHLLSPVLANKVLLTASTTDTGGRQMTVPAVWCGCENR